MDLKNRLTKLESHCREHSRCHWVDTVELYPDGREVFLYRSFVSTDFNKIVIVVPTKESEDLE